MASNNILQQIRDLINNAGLALEDALEQIVPGADPAYWRRLLDRQPAPAAPRKPHRRSSGSRRTPSKRTNYAAAVTARAMSEQLDRVNGHAGTNDPHGEETDNATRAILWNAGGELHILEVR